VNDFTAAHAKLVSMDIAELCSTLPREGVRAQAIVEELLWHVASYGGIPVKSIAHCFLRAPQQLTMIDASTILHENADPGRVGVFAGTALQWQKAVRSLFYATPHIGVQTGEAVDRRRVDSAGPWRDRAFSSVFASPWSGAWRLHRLPMGLSHVEQDA
jgi:hypothetical protein